MPVIPALWEAEAGRSLKPGSSRSAWATWQNLVSTTNTKVSQVWWHAAVVPATWELRREDHLNPGGEGYNEPRSHHCTPALGNRARLHLKKTKIFFLIGQASDSCL